MKERDLDWEFGPPIPGTGGGVNPLKPAPTVLIKLGSLAVHLDEWLSSDGHPFDRTAIDLLLEDQELKMWLLEMDKLAFLPKKRK